MAEVMFNLTVQEYHFCSFLSVKEKRNLNEEITKLIFFLFFSHSIAEYLKLKKLIVFLLVRIKNINLNNSIWQCRILRGIFPFLYELNNHLQYIKQKKREKCLIRKIALRRYCPRPRFASILLSLCYWDRFKKTLLSYWLISLKAHYFSCQSVNPRYRKSFMQIDLVRWIFHNSLGIEW